MVKVIILIFQADLRRADFRAKQRAMEDALMALEVKNKVFYVTVLMFLNHLVKLPLSCFGCSSSRMCMT